ncbi:MAG: VOC family protein [Candidatus Hodarchaeales archaeon]
MKDDHTTALGITPIPDDEPIGHGGTTVVFIVDILEEVIEELKYKGVEFIGDIYSDEMIKLIKFKNPSSNHLQLVEVIN